MVANLLTMWVSNRAEQAMTNTTNLIKIKDVLDKRFHEELSKLLRRVHIGNYMAGGIYQFYPEYIKFSPHHMYVKSEKGTTLIMPMPDNTGYWEAAQKLHDEFNKGVCV